MSSYKELLANINEFLFDYGVDLSLDYEELGTDHDMRFFGLQENNYDDLKNYFKILKAELAKYNPNFIKILAIKKFYFVRNLDIYNHSLDCFVSFQNYCSDKQGYIVIDIHDFKKKYESNYKLFLHHEIFHFILDNYADRLNLTYWEKLNEDFNKSGGYKYLLDRTFQYKSFAEDGFVSNFATLGILEDLSETYAYLMIDKYREKVINKTKKDMMLRYKFEAMSKFINELKTLR